MTPDNAVIANIDVKLDEIVRRIVALEQQGARPLFDKLIAEVVTTREILSRRMYGIEKTMIDVQKELRAVNNRLDIFASDISKIRGDILDHATRLDDLELSN